MNGEIDVLTEDGTVKECKQSAKAVSVEQFRRIASIAAAMFPGAPVHLAVPKGAGKKVTPVVPKNLIQEH